LEVLIIKSLGLSNLIYLYSISNVNFPKEIVPMVKDKMFLFLWKNKKDKIKRTSMYNGRLTDDIELTIKPLRLAWIKGLLFRDNCNWNFESSTGLFFYQTWRSQLPVSM